MEHIEGQRSRNILRVDIDIILFLRSESVALIGCVDAILNSDIQHRNEASVSK